MIEPDPLTQDRSSPPAPAPQPHAMRIPGPVDRVSFFDEQARRRRGTWRLSLVCLVIATAIGAILSTVLSPVLLALAGGLLHLLKATGIAPELSAQALRSLGGWATGPTAAFADIMNRIDQAQNATAMRALVPLALRAAVLLLPGMVITALAWAAFRAYESRCGMAGVAAAMGARAPRPGDFEERQIVNIVEEMALAAGLQAPRVMLIDAPAISAAAIGPSHRDATVVVTRGLLDRLDRDQTTGIVAHLIGSISNGDLRFTSSMLAVFTTLGFFLTMLDLPFRWSAWTALGRFLRIIMFGTPSAEAAEQSILALEESLQAESIEAINRLLGGGSGVSWVRSLLLLPLLPLILLNVLLKFILSLWILLFLGWPLAFLWRTRRYLADATAVQLTRDPEGLTRALQQIEADGGTVSGAETREYLFVHVPEGERPGGFRDRHGIAMPLQPRIKDRLSRLEALGAQSVTVAGARPTLGQRAASAGCLALIFAALSPFLFALLALVGMLTLGTVLFATGLGVVLVSTALGIS